ncbi:MAG: four helix bundle protein [Candidatus Omnitrophica bacterium]|nr:four helix bundle protein [Candidatus Omnitrophota bacterium]
MINQYLQENPSAEEGILLKEAPSSREFDLEARTLEFAKLTRELVRQIEKNIQNIEDAKQLIRSSGSVGANYIEANDALGKKDFFLKIKTCRREAKESRFWLKLLDVKNPALEVLRDDLVQEVSELILIFSAIAKKQML